METQQLREQHVYPEKEVLKHALRDSHGAFEKLMQEIVDAKYGLVPQWQYYQDGKAWLCKVSYKKKTVFWLSVWDKYFKASFFFTARNGAGIAGLDIPEKMKEDFKGAKPIGKLIPLIMRIDKKKQIKDVLTIVQYKMSIF